MNQFNFLQQSQIKGRILEQLKIYSLNIQEINTIQTINTLDNTNTINIQDFLIKDSLEFITFAYLKLLDRVPDAQGLQSYQTLLNQGIPKVWILHNIINSPEGQNKNAQIPGLYHPRKLIELLSLTNLSLFLFLTQLKSRIKSMLQSISKIFR